MTAINPAITLTLAQRNSDGFQMPIIVFMAKPSMIPASIRITTRKTPTMARISQNEL